MLSVILMFKVCVKKGLDVLSWRMVPPNSNKSSLPYSQTRELQEIGTFIDFLFLYFVPQVLQQFCGVTE